MEAKIGELYFVTYLTTVAFQGEVGVIGGLVCKLWKTPKPKQIGLFELFSLAECQVKRVFDSILTCDVTR